MSGDVGTGEALRTVTTARHQSEAELVRGMLEEEGIKSMVRRAPSFALPQFLGAAPHEVLVRESDYDTAYQLVHGHEVEPRPPGARSGPEPGNLLAVLLIGVGLIALIVWLSGNV
jgi:hypothetical protein